MVIPQARDDGGLDISGSRRGATKWLNYRGMLEQFEEWTSYLLKWEDLRSSRLCVGGKIGV